MTNVPPGGDVDSGGGHEHVGQRVCGELLYLFAVILELFQKVKPLKK